MLVLREFQHAVTTRDGVTLSVREYLPGASPPNRTLVFIHGACEHGGRYAALAKAATSDGWRVLIPDLRGHGLSGGVRVHVRMFDEYVGDISHIYRHFTLAAAKTAVVGHSMGALVVARWLQDDPGKVVAACLMSPYFGLKIRVDRMTWTVGQILLWVWPWFRFKSRVRSADLCEDQEYLQERRSDALICPSVTAGWFFAVQQALREVHERASEIRLPLLVIQGDRDPVTDPQATEAWVPRTSSSDQTFDIVAGGLHELLQGNQSGPIIQKIMNWINERVLAGS